MEGPRGSPVVSAGTNLTHFLPNNTANLNGSVTNALHAELHPHQGNNVLDESTVLPQQLFRAVISVPKSAIDKEKAKKKPAKKG